MIFTGRFVEPEEALDIGDIQSCMHALMHDMICAHVWYVCMISDDEAADVYIYTHIHVYAYVYMCTRTFTYIYTYIYIYIYVS